MQILIVEDAGNFSVSLADKLSLKGHEPRIATSLQDATFYLDSGAFMPDCLLVDSNMMTIGLAEDQSARSHGGLLSGVLWLEEIVFPRWPQLRNRTLVLTAYYDEIREILSTEPDRMNRLRLMPKTENARSAAGTGEIDEWLQSIQRGG